MWRYLAGAAAALAMAGAGFLLFSSRARTDSALPAQPVAQTAQSGGATAADPLPDTVPEASERTREQKRFDRYDKDRNDAVTREEYLTARRKAFAKLDVNHDGALSFDEWAVKAETKFATADRGTNEEGGSQTDVYGSRANRAGRLAQPSAGSCTGGHFACGRGFRLTAVVATSPAC